MLLQLTDIELIGQPEKFGNYSTAYRYIVGINAHKGIPEDKRLPIFYSIVEFYGKDFFNKLPKTEQDEVKKFYSKNKLGFKLSDPSIVGNTNETIKINNLDLNPNNKLKKNDNDFKNKTYEQHTQSNTRTEKAKSNYHIGKISSFGLLAIGIYFLFGFVYDLIPIAALIVLVIFDQIFNCLPGPKTIFCWFRSCSNYEEKENNPEQNKNKNIEDMEIKK